MGRRGWGGRGVEDGEAGRMGRRIRKGSGCREMVRVFLCGWREERGRRGESVR